MPQTRTLEEIRHVLQLWRIDTPDLDPAEIELIDRMICGTLQPLMTPQKCLIGLRSVAETVPQVVQSAIQKARTHGVLQKWPM